MLCSSGEDRDILYIADIELWANLLIYIMLQVELFPYSSYITILYCFIKNLFLCQIFVNKFEFYLENFIAESILFNL